LNGWVANRDSNKSVFVVTKPTVARWHRRLGHASPLIVQRVLSQNNLSFAKETTVE
jgi:hypothetical protein